MRKDIYISIYCLWFFSDCLWAKGEKLSRLSFLIAFVLNFSSSSLFPSFPVLLFFPWMPFSPKLQCIPSRSTHRIDLSRCRDLSLNSLKNSGDERKDQNATRIENDEWKVRSKIVSNAKKNLVQEKDQLMNYNRTMLVFILKREQCSCNENHRKRLFLLFVIVRQSSIYPSSLFSYSSFFFMLIVFFVASWSEPPKRNKKTYGCAPEKSHVYRAVGKWRECIGNVSRTARSVGSSSSSCAIVIEQRSMKRKSTDSIWIDKSNKCRNQWELN